MLSFLLCFALLLVVVLAGSGEQGWQVHAPSNKQDHPALEVTREEAPLVLCFAVLSFVSLLLARNRKQARGRFLTLIRAWFVLCFCLLSLFLPFVLSFAFIAPIQSLAAFYCTQTAI